MPCTQTSSTIGRVTLQLDELTPIRSKIQWIQYKTLA